MALIAISDDLSCGKYYGGDLSNMDSLTIYGCRYEVGMDHGDGQGATLTRVGLEDFPHHNTLDDLLLWDGDITQPDCELPPLYTTAKEYGRMCPDFAAETVDEILEDDAPITVFADNSWCVGHYDGTQTTTSLINE